MPKFKKSSGFKMKGYGYSGESPMRANGGDKKVKADTPNKQYEVIKAMPANTAEEKELKELMTRSLTLNLPSKDLKRMEELTKITKTAKKTTE